LLPADAAQTTLRQPSLVIVTPWYDSALPEVRLRLHLAPGSRRLIPAGTLERLDKQAAPPPSLN